MKTRQLPSIAISTLICLSSLPMKADEEADRAGLRKMRMDYEEAVNTGDLLKIKNSLSPNITGIMLTGKPFEGYQGIVSYWKEVQALIGVGGIYHVTIKSDKTDFYGDVSVSHGTTEEIIRLSTGRQLRFAALWTAICHKEAGLWKVIRIQATMDPVDNVFVALQLKKAKLTFSIIGAVAGIFIFLALRFIYIRTRSLKTDHR
jgi:ketosteroid isomerase-like protein